MSVPSIEMMINVSSDISQLITSYPIDSLPRFPALLSFNKLILSSSLSSSSCSVFSSPHGFFMFLYFIHCEHPETHFPYSTHSLPPGLTISPPLKANSSIFRQCPTSRVTLAFASRSWFHCSQFVERIEKKEKKRDSKWTKISVRVFNLHLPVKWMKSAVNYDKLLFHYHR